MAVGPVPWWLRAGPEMEDTGSGWDLVGEAGFGSTGPSALGTSLSLWVHDWLKGCPQM